jgi:putative phosphoesterase
VRVGLVSDTHGLVDPRLFEALDGCALLLHAGDVAGEGVLVELGAIAPVTAVRGNVDEGTSLGRLPDLATVPLGALTALLVHDAGRPQHRPRLLAAALARGRPDLVVSGHSHRPAAAVVEGTLFVNPGSAGPRRFHLPRCAAVLEITGRRVRIEWLDLAAHGRLAPLGAPFEATL